MGEASNHLVDEEATGQNDSASENSDKESKETIMMSTLESLEGTSNKNHG